MFDWHNMPLGMSYFHDMGLTSATRLMRNIAEKQRRDKMNKFIMELACLVPMVAGSAKKMDKTSILRLSANFLRMYRCLPLKPGEIQEPFLPILDSLRVSRVLVELLEAMGGFMLIITGAGKIVFVTHTVEKLLGHSQNDLLGQSIYNITSPEDHDMLRRKLTLEDPDLSDLCSPTGITSDESSSEENAGSTCSGSPSPPRPGPSTVEAEGIPPADHHRCSFFLRLAQRAAARGENAQYELVHLFGYLRVPRRPDPPPQTRTRRSREPASSNANDNVLVAVVQLIKEKKITELSLMEGNWNEYHTQHLRDGSIIYSDHRISVVAGYMCEEVSGMCAFQFMHSEDVNFTMIALQQMYDQALEYGCSTYRLRSKSGQYIYLKTRGFLQFKTGSDDAETFFCINTLVSKEEGEEGLQEMKKRFSALVHGKLACLSADELCNASDVVENSHYCPVSSSSFLTPIAEEQNNPRKIMENIFASYGTEILRNHAANENLVDLPQDDLKISIPSVFNSYQSLSRDSSSSENEAEAFDDSSALNNFINILPSVNKEDAISIKVSSAPSYEQGEDNDKSSHVPNHPFLNEPRQKVVTEGEITASSIIRSFSTTEAIIKEENWQNQAKPLHSVPKETLESSEPRPVIRASVITATCSGGSLDRRKYRHERRESVVIDDRVRGEGKRTHNSDFEDSRSSKRQNVDNGIMRDKYDTCPPLSIKIGEEVQEIVERGTVSPPFNSNSYPSVLVSSLHQSVVQERQPVLRTVKEVNSSCITPCLSTEHYHSVRSPEHSPPSPCHMSPDQGDSDSFSLLDLADPEGSSEVLGILDGTKWKDPLDTFQEPCSSSSPEAPEVAVSLDRILARNHLQLESCMQIQETQMHCIEQNLTQVPLAEQVFRSDLTQLQVQHKKQQLLLNNLKQDHQKIHCTKLKVSTVKQDVGVQ